MSGRNTSECRLYNADAYTTVDPGPDQMTQGRINQYANNAMAWGPPFQASGSGAGAIAPEEPTLH